MVSTGLVVKLSSTSSSAHGRSPESWPLIVQLLFFGVVAIPLCILTGLQAMGPAYGTIPGTTPKS